MRDLPFPSPVKVIFDVATGRFLDACTVVSPVLVHRHLSDQWKQHEQHESTLRKFTKQVKREPKQTIGRKWRSHRLPFPHAETTTTKCVPLIELVSLLFFLDYCNESVFPDSGRERCRRRCSVTRRWGNDGDSRREGGEPGFRRRRWHHSLLQSPAHRSPRRRGE